jgi:hypothetical protein
MILEVQMFDYVVKDEDGEIIGKYTSTDEPPLKGDIIDLRTTLIGKPRRCWGLQ